MAVSRTYAVKNTQYNSYYRNSSVVVDLLWDTCLVPQNVLRVLLPLKTLALYKPFTYLLTYLFLVLK